ncbi:MAG: hydrogenase formation protein HypD [Bacillota bacterium]|nr:hydrogenase formation protein HypD [Bacillota bacterium]
MKYSIEDLIKQINFLADGAGDIAIMEVCGTHTASIRKFGIMSILPENIKMVSGPGCPVCVTSQEDISAAVAIADREGVIFTCFGDMMRVPCDSTSLYSLFEKGRDVRLVTSPMDAKKIAQENPEKQVVYFGIGFETTAPHTAALVEEADKEKIKNLSVLNSHKTMPSAIKHLLQADSKISALLCPGHVASIIGADAFSFVPDILHLPAAVAGFDAYEILAAILRILDMIHSNKTQCINMYPKAVTKNGNRKALELLYQVMEPDDALWRGLGNIPESGLKFREYYEEFDARYRFEIPKNKASDANGCVCAHILRGKKIPTQCIHFGKDCTPDNPVGPCMVSAEGSCAAYYRYRE